MPDLTVVSPRGTITISRDVVAEIVAETAARCYGVVGLTPAPGSGSCFAATGSPSAATRSGLRIGLHVVVEYGLNLAEVASTIRSQVAYDVRAAHRAPGRDGRGVRRGRPGQRMRERVLELARGALAAIEAARARIDDLNVYPGSRRRHRHQPHADRSRRGRGARGARAPRSAPRSRTRSRARP